MASIRAHTSRAGTTTFQVRFRLDGRASSRTFTTRQDAQRWARILDQLGPTEARPCSPPPASRPPSLRVWLEHHLEHATGIATGTRIEHQRLAARTWLPQLGEVPVDRLTRDQVSRWVTSAAAALSAKSVKNAHSLLSTVLASAVIAGHRPDNPARGVRLPRGTRREMVFLTRQEYEQLLEHVPERWRLLVAFLVGTGLRWSEATALTWDDVTLTGPLAAVRVTRAWKKVDGTGTAMALGPPKTSRSVRTVILPRGLADDLCRAHAAARPARTELVFTAERGGQLRHQDWRPRVWRPACRASGLDPAPRIHDLRHTHASWLIAAGQPLLVVQRRLGHESITTTVDTYTHLNVNADAVAASAVTNS